MQIDWSKAEQLAMSGCTIEELSAAMGVNEDVFRRCYMADMATEDFPNAVSWVRHKNVAGIAFLKASMFQGAVKDRNPQMLKVFLNESGLSAGNAKGRKDELDKALSGSGVSHPGFKIEINRNNPLKRVIERREVVDNATGDVVIDAEEEKDEDESLLDGMRVDDVSDALFGLPNNVYGDER